MELKDFETLFHLSVLFNFIYSAVEDFSKRLGMFFSQPFQNIGIRTLGKFSTIVQNIQDSQVLKNESLDTSTITGNLNKYFVDINRIIANFVNPKKYDLEYGQKFKSLYLLAAFFSFFILFLLGLDRYCDQDKIYYYLFPIDCLITLVFLYVLTSTFVQNIKCIRQLFVLIIFLAIISFFIILYLKNISFAFHVPDKECVIFFTLTLVLLPFFLHFIRILLQVLYIQGYIFVIRIIFRKKFADISNEVSMIEFSQQFLKGYGKSDDEIEKKTNPEKPPGNM